MCRTTATETPTPTPATNTTSNKAKPADSSGGGLASGVVFIIGICAVVGVVALAVCQVASWTFLRSSRRGEFAIPETSENDRGISMSSAVPAIPADLLLNTSEFFEETFSENQEKEKGNAF